jgi:hypothetical protein
VPSVFLSDVASADAGTRISDRDLDAMQTVAGGRDVFAPDDRSDATNIGEHILSSLSSDVEAKLATLGDHVWARRLLRLHRAIDRYHRPAQGADPVLDAWSGRVDPALVAHEERTLGTDRVRANLSEPDAPALTSETLAKAIVSPTEYFFRQVLGAFRPGWFGGRNAPTEKWTMARWLKEAVDMTLESPGQDLDATFEAAWDQVVERALRHRPPEDHEEATAARELALGHWGKIRGEVEALASATRQALEGLPVADDLAWRLRGDSGFVLSDSLNAWDEEKQPTKKNPHKITTLGLQVLALELAGASARSPVLRGVDGSKHAPRGWSADAARAQARQAAERIAVGLWPVAGGAFRLHREPSEETSS